ncbi:KdsC family phosphatase [Candidatus Nitrosotenuis uzonensis]|uniref:KdsC family phosphatase n=1 Tax=Candidatus Nitrosotenuis uzonensis TaxID=1407055 RepID=UPI001EF9EF55|nr:HAD hydrolase family protein [Candidatus Nitrosotenuis uzonensis]
MRKRISPLILKKCQLIKLILTDVDGVLTDGGRIYSDKGEMLKKFHVRDGMAVNLLLTHSIYTCIVTRENSTITKQWASDMNVKKVYMNAKNKENLLSDICNTFKIVPKEVAFIGDDVNDELLLQSVGLSACPNDANSSTKKISDYVCSSSGGKGAFRELADLIISMKIKHKKKLKQ